MSIGGYNSRPLVYAGIEYLVRQYGKGLKTISCVCPHTPEGMPPGEVPEGYECIRHWAVRTNPGETWLVYAQIPGIFVGELPADTDEQAVMRELIGCDYFAGILPLTHTYRDGFIPDPPGCTAIWRQPNPWEHLHIRDKTPDCRQVAGAYWNLESDMLLVGHGEIEFAGEGGEELRDFVSGLILFTRDGQYKLNSLEFCSAEQECPALRTLMGGNTERVVFTLRASDVAFSDEVSRENNTYNLYVDSCKELKDRFGISSLLEGDDSVNFYLDYTPVANQLTLSAVIKYADDRKDDYVLLQNLTAPETDMLREKAQNYIREVYEEDDDDLS